MTKLFKVSVVAAAMFASGLISAATITLDGRSLTMDDAWKIAVDGDEVAISAEAEKRIRDTGKLVMAGAASGKPFYGLTTGVGLNKDRPLFNPDKTLTDEVIQASKNFNYNALRSHSAGIGPMMPKHLARLSMVIRLNTLLSGQSGAQYRVAEMYRDFLNKGVTPLIPSQGSLGEADVCLASHVGAVMIGEWKAEINGEVVDGKTALSKAGIEPLVPMGKDALAILSNNSVAIAYAVDAFRSARQVIKVTPTVYGLSLEGLNGNVAPFLPQTIKVRQFPGLLNASGRLCQALKGSYIWNYDSSRPLQDPLSFRVTIYGLAEANKALDALEEELTVQINTTDDNPATILDASGEYREFSHVDQYFIEGNGVKGAIIPSGNFNPLPVTLAMQRTSLALAQLSQYSVQRTIHLSYDQFTGLPRFLTASGANLIGNMGHSFGAIQKAFVGINNDTLSLAQPVLFYGVQVAGEIEDTFTNVLQTAQRLKAIDNNLFSVYSYELLHSTQAIDIRRLKNKDLKIADETSKLYAEYRKVVPYVERDRIFTDDLAEGVKLLNKF